MRTTVATRVNLGKKCKHVSGLAGLGEHVFITAIGLNQRMFWLKCLGQNSVCSLFLRAEPLERHFLFCLLFSHVEMACGIIHVVLKKVAVIIRRTSKGENAVVCMPAV